MVFIYLQLQVTLSKTPKIIAENTKWLTNELNSIRPADVTWLRGECEPPPPHNTLYQAVNDAFHEI